ncbi:MAG: hypothetical protein CBC88_03225 [Candidatus Pelagibacter sp. TMED128]|nr:MAG: hypothetical protein CBC88_03225 [Candidatus Pelagibacter sp. TMED128]
MKKNFLILLISCLIFFSVDFFIGKIILNSLYKSNILESPEKIKFKVEQRKKNEKSYRIKNDFYHHTLKSNIKVKSIWGDISYSTCTDQLGFRTSCEKNTYKKNKRKIIFIGDSFTEGLGLGYQDTFVGMFDKFSSYQIINMGVTSYSPIIYWNKIKHFLDKGLSADHVIVFIDVSDIDDEANNYKKCSNSLYVCDKIEKKEKILKDQIKNKKEFIFPLLNHIKMTTKKLKRKIKPKIYIYRKDFKRSYWTYSESNEEIKRGIKSSINYMENLSNYLNSKNITLSVAVYPHPGQILHDTKNSQHVQIWKNFCKQRCKYFIDLFPIFFENENKEKKMDIIKKYYIKNDIHFNKDGNEKIFDQLIKLDFGAPGRS